MAKLLIVDDEIQIIDLIKKYARFSGYDCDVAYNGKEAIELVKQNNSNDENGYSLIIMDIMMPEMDGFTAVKEIRKFSSLPVILLSARSEEYDKLYGFDLGIDDYVTKPFSPKELMMRVGAILSRYARKTPAILQPMEDLITYKDLVINLNEHVAYVNKERVEFTLKEYELLVLLMENMNTALKRDFILEKVWGSTNRNNERTLDTHVKSIRKKIGEYASNIVTIRRVGYRFEKR